MMLLLLSLSLAASLSLPPCCSRAVASRPIEGACSLSLSHSLSLSLSQSSVTQLKILQAAPCVITAELQLSQES